MEWRHKKRSKRTEQCWFRWSSGRIKWICRNSKGLVDLELFRIPQEKVEGYDGNVLQFSVSEDEALSKYRRESTETLSQAEESITSTFYEQGTPLKDKGTDPD